MEQRRPTWAEISLSALKHNYLTIRNHLGAAARLSAQSPAQLMAVVKADAYGHGAVECARALEDVNADWFGVALVEEGIELRQAGVARPIFLLGGFWRGQAGDVIAHDLTPAVYRIDQAEELNARAGALGRMANFHLKVDTGMGRLGVQLDELTEFARSLGRFDSVKLDGVMTHFATADSDTTD
jgi:alanine racemase